jgi:hypothetical protein
MRRFGGRPNGDSGKAKPTRVYKLDGGRAEPIDVTVGPSDGVWTELRKGDVAPDTPLVVDAVTSKK